MVRAFGKQGERTQETFIRRNRNTGRPKALTQFKAQCASVSRWENVVRALRDRNITRTQDTFIMRDKAQEAFIYKEG